MRLVLEPAQVDRARAGGERQEFVHGRTWDSSAWAKTVDVAVRLGVLGMPRNFRLGKQPLRELEHAFFPDAIAGYDVHPARPPAERAGDGVDIKRLEPR